MIDSRSTFRKLRPFLIWLVAFYSVWLGIVLTGGYWSTIASHWGIALAMSFGSYIAGSTPMGGGTVGFPVLVLLFDMPGSLGRNFGLAIQSIGMVSAAIYIFSMRHPLDWKLLRPTLVGSLVGTPLGAAFIAPHVSDLLVKLTFAVIWASFGIMHLVKLKELIAQTGENSRWQGKEFLIGICVGVLGGVSSSITGVGIDMMLYATMVLLFQADSKISIPSSVVVMAFTSVLGISFNLLLAHFIPARFFVAPEVFYNWLAAAPVVALGAPLGAIVVNVIPRKFTLIFVSLLCIIQFAWTIIHEQVRGLELVLSILGVLAVNVVFHVLYRWGRGESLIATNAAIIESTEGDSV
jgi:uncharacterized protein